jgi:hypothetical protein
MRYEFLDLPCLNRSFLCTHAQYVKEYKPLYAEFDFNVPKEVTEKVGDQASTNCLLIFLTPVMSVKDAAWLCHLEEKVILEVQVRLSGIIYDANIHAYTFMAKYVQGQKEKIRGTVSIDKDKMFFTDAAKNVLFTATWRDIEPYATALYLKEDLIWKGDEVKKPEPQRCLKVFRKAEIVNHNPDYFCIHNQRNDITMKLKMPIPVARFAAELYTNKINIRLQQVIFKDSILDLSKYPKGSLEVDSKLLGPVKHEVRRQYFIDRHELVNRVKAGELKKNDMPNKLSEAKENVIERVCAGIELCKKATAFTTDTGLLPLSGNREKFAMDIQNPYDRLMPHSNMKVDQEKSDSVGQKIMSTISEIKGAKNYFAEKIPEQQIGGVPNSTAIRKAFNTFKNLRQKNTHKSADELLKTCSSQEKSGVANIRRKISFLFKAGENDPFFEYLGYIKDFQTTKNDK